MSMVLSKAIRLIDLVAGGADTLAGIAAASELSRSTTHRLLATLVEHNYLILENKKYALGYRLLELGEMKKRSLNFLDALRPVLLRYAELTSDTIHLAILDGKDIVLLDRVFGNRQLRINSFPGLRNTAFMTAVGKALIGQLPTRKWPAFLENMPAEYRRTKEQIMADFRKAQHENIAIDFDEVNVGTCGIASTFQVNDQRHVACSINGATVYFPQERLRELRPLVLKLADELKAAVAQQQPGIDFDARHLGILR